METDLPRAETMLQRALALDPGYSDARNNLALLFARTGRDDEAEAALRASLAADPADIPAMVNLAVFLRDRRHNYTGTARASTACSCNPTAPPVPATALPC
jgi:Flp pilus assembly protein TadD